MTEITQLKSFEERMKERIKDSIGDLLILHSIVKELLEPTVRKVADAWVNEHKEEVLKVVDAVISEGMAKALLRAIDTKFQNDLFNHSDRDTK